MARMKPKAVNTSVLFDVFYEDGGRTSNRKVPGTEIGGPPGVLILTTLTWIGRGRKWYSGWCVRDALRKSPFIYQPD